MHRQFRQHYCGGQVIDSVFADDVLRKVTGSCSAHSWDYVHEDIP